MTGRPDPPAGSSGSITPDPGRARPRNWRAAALLAAAAPLAAALAGAPAAVAVTVAVAPTAGHRHAQAGELLVTATLPVTTIATSGGDPKIPEAVGD
jgi:hypothetical protein